MRLDVLEQKTESNCNLENQQFAIKQSPIAFEILSSKLYSKPELAVIRELLTNAYDAQILANNDTEIDVHLPDSKSQNLIIRDYGVGLTDDEIIKLYSTFFSSSKTDSNDFTGCFGLGSKTPFAISSTFSVKSYKDGTLNIYACVKKDGLPHIYKLGSEETTEHNGLCINIPFNDDYVKMQSIKNAFHEYIKFIPEMKIKLNGRKFENQQRDCIVFGNTRIYQRWNGRLYIKQGQNVYAIESHQYKLPRFTNNIVTEFDMVVEVPIGTLQITPNREQLSRNEENDRKVREAVCRASSDIYLNIIEDHQYRYTKYRVFNDIYIRKINREFFDNKEIVVGLDDNFVRVRNVSVLRSYFLNSNTNGLDEIYKIPKEGNFTIVKEANLEGKTKVSRLRKRVSSCGGVFHRILFIKSKETCDMYSYDRYVLPENERDINISYGQYYEQGLKNIEDFFKTYQKLPFVELDIEYMEYEDFLKEYKEERETRIHTIGNIVSYEGKIFYNHRERTVDFTYHKNSLKPVVDLKLDNEYKTTLVYQYNNDDRDRDRIALIACLLNLKDMNRRPFLKNFFEKEFEIDCESQTLHLLGVTKTNINRFEDYRIIDLDEINLSALNCSFKVLRNIQYNPINPYTLIEYIKNTYGQKQRDYLLNSFLIREYQAFYKVVEKYNYYSLGYSYNAMNMLVDAMNLYGEQYAKKHILYNFPIKITNGHMPALADIHRRLQWNELTKGFRPSHGDKLRLLEIAQRRKDNVLL